MAETSNHSEDGRRGATSKAQLNPNHHKDVPGGSPGGTTTTTEAYAHGLYRGLVEDTDIETFLWETDAYDSAQATWSIPLVPKTTEGLIGAMYGALQSIVGRFVRSFQPGIEREVCDTQDLPTCQGSNADGYRVCPALFVRAAGPSFEIPEPLASEGEMSSTLGFSNMATYFSVKMESELGSKEECVEEMSSYARCVSCILERDEPC